MKHYHSVRHPYKVFDLSCTTVVHVGDKTFHSDKILLSVLTLSCLVAAVPGLDISSNNTIDIQLPYVSIPAVETYYVCQQFQIPDDETYHVTKFEPMINNSAMLHHMLLFGCEFEMDDQGPHPCYDLDYRCRTWLVKWDVGMDDVIEMPRDTGVRIGKGSFKYILLQIHWNNPNKRNDETDASGMKLHLTKNLRKYDIGNVQLGQNQISIPALTPSTAVSGTCPRRCTGIMLPGPIYISHVYLHMHGLGIQSALDVYQDREVVTRIAYEDNYNYTKPVWHTLDPPAVVYPGDDLRVTCWYNSLDSIRQRNDTTSFGQGSSAEMCYSFIRYYPRVIGFDQCIQQGDKTLNC